MVSDLVDFDQSPESPANKAFFSAVVPVFQCPSAPGYPRLLVDPEREVSVGARDQTVVTSVGVHGNGAASEEIELFQGGWFSGSRRDLFLAFGRPEVASYRGAPWLRRAKLAAIEDGLSKTLMLVEQAGLPQLFERGRAIESPKFANPVAYSWFGAWGSGYLKIYHDPPRDPVNYRNDENSVYGFHSDGAVAANFDGSVTTLPVDIDKRVLTNRLARNDGK